MERNQSFHDDFELKIIDEPKTLTKEEFKQAKEKALQVIEIFGKEDALKIFTEGLKPVKLQPEQNLMVNSLKESSVMDSELESKDHKSTK